MAGSGSTIKIEILGDAGSAQKAFQDVETSAGKAQKPLDTLSKSMDTAGKASDESGGHFKLLGGVLDGLKSKASGIGDALKLGTALSVASAGVGAALGGLSKGFDFVKQAAFGMNASLETTTLQFSTLMGNSDAAKQHVADLFKFAKDTPFETQPVIDASKAMRTFGGDALDTMGNLSLIGDAAAATGSPIQELGFWTGRLYSDLQGGKPFGEAATRMQELAVLTPQARKQMEDMQASGASADQIFQVFQQNLGHFTGAMKTQAGTWQGLTSTFSDTVSILAAQGLKPLFDSAKVQLGKLNDWLASDAVQQGITKFAAAFAQVASAMSTVVSGKIFPALVGLVGMLRGPVTAGFVLIRDTFITFIEALQGNWTDAPGIVGLHEKIGQIGLLIRNEIIPDVKALADWFMSTALPAIVSFASDAKADIASIADWIQTNVFPRIQQAFTWWQTTGAPQAQDFATKVITAVRGITDWITGTGIPLLQRFASWFMTDALPPISAFAARVSAFVQTQIIPAIKALSDFLLNTVWPTLSKVINDAITLFGTLADWTKTHWETIQAVISPIVASIQTVITVAWNTISGVTEGVWTAIKGIVEGVLKLIDGLITFWTGIFSGNWGKAWDGIKLAYDGVWVAIKGIVEGALKVIETLLSSAWQLISGEISNAWDAIKTYFGLVMGDIKDAITQPIDGARNDLEGIWKAISDKAGDAWDGIKKKFDDGKEDLKEALLWPYEEMRDGIGGILDTAKSNAGTPINAVISGVNKVGGAVGGALNFIGDKLDIGSLKSVAWKDLPGFAKGVRGFGGGLAIVGEEGPEIVNLPSGSDVLSNPETKAILAGAAKGYTGIGGPLDFASGVVKKAGDAIGDVWERVQDWVEKPIDWILNQAFHLDSVPMPGAFNDLGSGLLGTAKSGLKDFITGIVKGLKDFGGDFPGGQSIIAMAQKVHGDYMYCEKFVGDVMQALGKHYSRAGSAEQHAHMQGLNHGLGPKGAIDFFPWVDSEGNSFGHVGFSMGDGHHIYGTMNNGIGTGVMDVSGWTPYGWTINPAANGAYVTGGPKLLLTNEGRDPEGEITSPVAMLRKVVREEMGGATKQAPIINNTINGIHPNEVETQTRRALRRVALEGLVS